MNRTAAASLAIGTILILAAALRLYGIERETAWNDEALSLRFLDAPTYRAYADPLFTHDHGIRHVPAYFVAQYGWSRVFGPSVLSLRLFSLTCGLASIVVLYLLTARLAGQRAAAAAVALFAVSLPHIYYAQEVRFYALVTLLVLISNYCFIRAVRDNGRTWWWGLGIVDAVLPWTHVFSPLIWLVHGAFLILFRRSWWRTILAWGAFHGFLVMVFALWLWRVEYEIVDEYVKQATPTWRELLNAFNVYAGGRFEKLNPALYLPTGISADRVITVLLLGLMAWAIFDILRRWRKEESTEARQSMESAVFCVLWFLAPPLFLYAVSQVWKPFFLFRYTLYCSLGLYAIAGMALDRIPRDAARNTVLVMLAVLFAHQLTVRMEPFRPDYRAADAHIRTEGGAPDRVLVLKELNGVPFRFNTKLPPERVESFEGLGDWYAAAEEEVELRGQVWLLLWQFETELVETYFASKGYVLEQHRFQGIPPLFVYRLYLDRLNAAGVFSNGLVPLYSDGGV